MSQASRRSRTRSSSSATTGDFRKNKRGELGTKTATLNKDGLAKLRQKWLYLDRAVDLAEKPPATKRPAAKKAAPGKPGKKSAKTPTR